MSHFQPVELTVDSRTYVITTAEMAPLVSAGDYWHGEGDPSSWLTVSVFHYLRRRFPEAPQDLRLDLTARCLGISVETVLNNIAFNENYMRFHDGDDSYRVLD
jgi:hypothetical protein